MLPSGSRLHTSDEFSAVVRTGRRSASGSLVVHLLIDPSGSTPGRSSRVGFVVSGKVGNAVVRHRITRRLRVLIRPLLADLPPGTDVVVRGPNQVRRAPLTTLAETAATVGIEAGFPWTKHRPGTDFEPQAELAVDPAAAAALAHWFAVGAEALTMLVAEMSAERPSAPQIFPEHFDLGITAGPVSEDDLLYWEALIQGPEGTPFEGGVFPAELRFPKDYPLAPPTMKFLGEVWHPNGLLPPSLPPLIH